MLHADAQTAIAPASKAIAPPVAPPVAPPAKTEVVRAGKLVDVRTGNITQDAYIVITGDRIVSVSGKAPAGSAPVIDMSRYSIVPA